MNRATRLIGAAMALSTLELFGGITAGPVPAPVAAGTPKESIPRSPGGTLKCGWLTSGRLPKRRSLAERKQRRAKHRQRSL